jgi:YhcN/YlaJ family sporulation lipoprotein
MGCTPKQMNRTQTRLGTERPNNVARRDNLTNPNVRPNVSPNVTGRDTIVNPNTGTNMTGRNTIVNPNTTPNTVRRDTLTNPNLRTEIGGNTTNTDLMARANFIAKKVTDLNEVDKASALITGDTALVGVEIKNNIKGQMTTDLKRRIETTVKNTDSRIKNVAVTADPNLSTRIRDMVFDIENGKPLSGFAVEIKEILRRITPVK